jgi:hypothetical protein
MTDEISNFLYDGLEDAVIPDDFTMRFCREPSNCRALDSAGPSGIPFLFPVLRIYQQSFPRIRPQPAEPVTKVAA